MHDPGDHHPPVIDGGASDEVKRALGPVIDVLRDWDWDTEYESLEQFLDDPVIVALFAERGLTIDKE
jgi:hypothetical protein